MCRILCLLFLCIICNAAISKNTNKKHNPIKINSYSYSLLDEVSTHAQSETFLLSKKNIKDRKISKTPNSKYFFYAQSWDLYDIQQSIKSHNQLELYSIGKFAAKLSPYQENNETQNINISSFRLNYEISPGISPYLETKYVKDIYEYDKIYKNPTSSGMFLIGTKIDF